MSYICPKCKKTRKRLIEENKLNSVQGHEQCADCYADLEHQSVVMREALDEEASRKALENDDYIIIPACEQVKKVLGIEEHKILNTHKYLPEWRKKEIMDEIKKTNEMFIKMHEDGNHYNKTSD